MSRSSQPHPHPQKSLGQHFLVDEAYADRIVAAAELMSGDAVLEIGPGKGVLTRRLVQQAGRVVAVEIDRRFVDLLRAEVGGAPALTVIHGDILDHAPAQLMAREGEPEDVRPYKVVANLPYYITSPVLRHLLEATQPPSLAVVMVQKEVAQRICAQPGDLSTLAVSVQFYATPEIVFTVPAGAFRPRPRVESAVIRLALRPSPAVTDVAPSVFFQVVRAGFGQKRKQLANSLSAGLAMPKEGAVELLRRVAIDPSRRAETLSLDEWGAFAREWERSRKPETGPAHLD